MIISMRKYQIRILKIRILRYSQFVSGLFLHQVIILSQAFHPNLYHLKTDFALNYILRNS